MSESTKQLTASAGALALQHKVIARQQFETTFFQMLGLFNKEIESDDHKQRSKGRLCIFKLSEELIDSIQGIKDEKIIKSQCQNFFNQYNDLLGHYFRTLYSIIKFVDKSNLENENKKVYTSIIRA